MEAFRLLSEVFDEIDLESSGVKQKNSSSADEDSPNLLFLLFVEDDGLVVCWWVGMIPA